MHTIWSIICLLEHVFVMKYHWIEVVFVFLLNLYHHGDHLILIFVTSDPASSIGYLVNRRCVKMKLQPAKKCTQFYATN